MAANEPDSLESEGGGRRATSRELVLVIVIVLAAAALRFAYPSRLAVEHFDEGVYASNIWFTAADGYRYPARQLYAPPLLPALIEWSIILFGDAALSVKLVSLLAGSLTVPLVWWTARRWFGPAAGIAAASLAAFSDFHILFSRMALTDALLCLWLLAAVYCAGEMFARGSLRWAIAAGAATGLAWSTKYNGWLPLAIAPAGCLLFRLVSRWKNGQPASHAGRRLMIPFAAMLLTALAVWSPVWFDLSRHGGYAAVAANHRGYVGGWFDWWPHLLRQFDNHLDLDGWLSGASLALAALSALLVSRGAGDRSTWNVPQLFTTGHGGGWERTSPADHADWREAIGLALVLSAAAAWFGSSLTIGLLALAGIGLHLRRRAPLDSSTLPCCLLAVWLGGLSLATPFYHPYPRLTLPWLLAAWLGGGAAIGWVAQKLMHREARPAGNELAGRQRQSVRWILLVVSLASLGALALHVDRWREHGVPGWQSQTGLKKIAAAIADEVTTQIKGISPRPRGLIQVYAEPGLFYQLSAVLAERSSPIAVVPVASIQPPSPAPGIPVFLAIGPNGQRDSRLTDALQRNVEGRRLVAEYPYRPSELIRLNWGGPGRGRGATRPAQPTVRLYRDR